MSKITKPSMNIYYFNITYTCNSNCVFCYSHNTIHSGRKYKEIELLDFKNYLDEKCICSDDRVIINGGEPFLHSQIIDILQVLYIYQCEVLIYTNGRCISKYDLSFLNFNYRFVLPFHGYEQLHDKITQREGSYQDMIKGLEYLKGYKCFVDIKIILNNEMIISESDFSKTLAALDCLSFNYAVHITKMADTIVSIKNNIPSIPNKIAGKYTALLFDHLRDKCKIIKIFDTCVCELPVQDYDNSDIPLRVFFKDERSEWELTLATPEQECRKSCPFSLFCESAVGNYTVLEYNGKFYKGIE